MTFLEELAQINGEFEGIKQEEAKLGLRVRAANEVLQGFLKRYGLPENFTLTEAMLLSARIGKPSIEVVQ